MFRECRLKIFLFRAAGHRFQQTINNLVRFNRGHNEKLFREIVLNLGQWLILKICHHCDQALANQTQIPFYNSICELNVAVE